MSTSDVTALVSADNSWTTHNQTHHKYSYSSNTHTAHDLLEDGRRRCFVADQLWLMTRIREEERNDESFRFHKKNFTAEI